MTILFNDGTSYVSRRDCYKRRESYKEHVKKPVVQIFRSHGQPILNEIIDEICLHFLDMLDKQVNGG